jgi:nucleotide-binding universal stress UspA family protein
MMKILIATDGSTDARLAAQWLADFPLPDDVSALAISAVQLPPSPIDIPTVVEFKRTLLDDARQAADDVVAVLKPRVAAVESRAVVGDPRTEIVRIAEEWGADLVVVGARGLGAVATAVLGSVSLAVARHASCSVLVVRPNPKPLRSVAVGVDGSENAREAARFLARFGLPPSVGVRLVGVVDRPPFPRTAPASVRAMLQEAVAVVIEERRQALNAALGSAAESFETAARELPVGAPAETLERLSADVDLIVLGARGLGPVKRLLLGSVSEHLLRHAACAVLIVHRRGAG